MSHVIVTNLQAPSTDDFIGVWKLTRCMLAAGWKYRSSGDATTATKDVSGVSGTFESAFASDKWGVDGGTNLNSNVQTGTTVTTITANTDGTATIVFTATTFTASSVGRFLNLAGDANTGNNGTFRITTFNSATSIKVFLPGAVTEASPTVTSWHEQEGGATGTISTSGTGGAQPGRAIFTITGSTPWTAPTTSPTVTRGSTGDRLTIIGAAVGANNGTFLISRVISTSSVEIENPNATSSGETNNGSLHWVECSPTAQSYPASINGNAVGTGAWWNAQGPSMMKILIGTATVTGTFVRGEVVTQTGTGATGAIIGVLPDTVNGLGYLVIEPRLNGTGAAATGPRGWNNTGADTVSAAAAPAGSGASVATTTGPIEYIQEVVFWKNNNQNGHWWVQCVDQSAESTSRYSQIASTSGAVTNAIAPGGATATFPIPGSWVVGGTANSNVASTGSIDWYQETLTASVGLLHFVCANCIPTSTTSADGSFLIMAGSPTNSPSSYVSLGWQRCDDSEDGDVIPYVAFAWPNGDNYAGTRTVQTSAVSAADFFRLDNGFSENSYTPFRGWRRRGFSTGDAFQEFGGFTIQAWANANWSAQNPTTTCHIACTFSTTPVFVREPIWVISAQATQKMRKGTFRWLFNVEGAVSGQTYGAGSWVAVSAQTSVSMVVGPWDGQSLIANG